MQVAASTGSTFTLRLLVVALLLVLITGCGSSAAQEEPTGTPTQTAPPTFTPSPTTPVLVRFFSPTPTRGYSTPTLVRARSTATRTPTKPKATTAATAKPTATLKPGTCPQGGCKTPPPGCDVKGNIEANGEKRYYYPGMPSYDKVTIDPDAGERWFCSEQSALLSAWRKALE